jgi:hypothetical protein
MPPKRKGEKAPPPSLKKAKKTSLQALKWPSEGNFTQTKALVQVTQTLMSTSAHVCVCLQSKNLKFRTHIPTYDTKPGQIIKNSGFDCALPAAAIPSGSPRGKGKVDS